MAGTSSEREGKNVIFPKTEDFDYGMSPYTTLSRGFEVWVFLKLNASIRKLE